MLDVYGRHGGRYFDEDDGPKRPSTRLRNFASVRLDARKRNFYSRADSEPTKRDRVVLGNSGSSRGPGLSGARLGCTLREKGERERGRKKGYEGGERAVI